mgnify:FL=1
MSERTTTADQTLDDVWLVNATLFASRLLDTWDISLSVYNLFNARYRDPAFNPDTVEQDGSTLRLKILGRF